jgi:small-conductance mechanosensitive channel
VRNLFTAIVTTVATLMVLRELNVDVMPVLTGAGIIGLAVGFGAQTLVKDFISGFFLILENHIRVGDVARINGTGGLVEAINLRTTVLRDLEGIVHVFPNGSIETLSNLTKDFAFYVVDVGVAYKEDTDAVVEVLREVGAELTADPILAESVLAPLEVLGVDAFEDSQVTIKIRIKTLPLKQWEVGRELRRRIKKAFDARAIEIPFPHLSVYFGEASRPFAVKREE